MAGLSVTQRVAVRVVTFADGSREVLGRACESGSGTPAENKLWFEQKCAASYFKKELLSVEEKAERSRSESVRRARKNLRWAILAIEADRLLTLTYRENVVDRERALRDWKAFCRLMELTFPGWQYVCVMESQTRGAIHFHAAIKGFYPVNEVRRLWRRVVGADNGNIDIALRKKRWGGESEEFSPTALAFYLAKYVGKEMSSVDRGEKRFFCSRGRPVPVTTRFWIESCLDADAIRRLYRIAAGEKALGASQWFSRCERFYWVYGPASEDEPLPF